MYLWFVSSALEYLLFNLKGYYDRKMKQSVL